MNSNSRSIKKLYYSIGEVSKITDLKQYVLRYWETEFKQLNPNKNKAGNRTYRQKDIDTILEIKNLLYKEKFTIEGARKMLVQPSKNTKVIVEAEKKAITTGVDKKTLEKIRNELKTILDELQN
tara:strand:+ start:194 stop:565 length:372 start_codon:yes stop_codon:yes gene_type:complete